MNFPVLSFLYFLVCGIAELILWIKMVAIIQSKGIELNASFIIPFQYVKFWRIIQGETDHAMKKKYKRLFWIQIAIIPAYLIGEFLLLPFG